MSELVKTNIPNLYKDTRTGAVINTNEYVRPTKNLRPDKEVIFLRNEVGSLKTEIKELKDLLLQIVNGKN
jgi:hypothetical protein